jgi:hypothetical protein
MFQTNVAEKKKTHFVFNNFFSENHVVYEIIWKNVVESGRPQMDSRHMRFSCWITKSTDTRSEYVIYAAFPLQQWLRKRVSMLRYTYIAFLGVL